MSTMQNDLYYWESIFLTDLGNSVSLHICSSRNIFIYTLRQPSERASRLSRNYPYPLVKHELALSKLPHVGVQIILSVFSNTFGATETEFLSGECCL